METAESIVLGVTDVALIESSIGSFFEQVANRWPEREALVVPHQGVRWRYREFAAKVDALAANLLQLGLNPGDRIGIWS